MSSDLMTQQLGPRIEPLCALTADIALNVMRSCVMLIQLYLSATVAPTNITHIQRHTAVRASCDGFNFWSELDVCCRHVLARLLRRR